MKHKQNLGQGSQEEGLAPVCKQLQSNKNKKDSKTSRWMVRNLIFEAGLNGVFEDPDTEVRKFALVALFTNILS